MALPKSELYLTVAEYLAMERESEERHIYLDGQIYLMAGETPAHGDICTNLTGLLHAQLRGTRCRVWTKDFRVRSGPKPKFSSSKKGLYSYSDLVVVCGEPQFHDDRRDLLTNPAAIIEVLSDATEAFDRGEKFRRYAEWNLALTDYVLVSQTLPVVDHFTRQNDGGWNYHVYSGLEASLTIQSINCSLRLADVYERVTFPLAEEESATIEEP